MRQYSVYSILVGIEFHIVLFFFFSSRRRHTRCLSDWSSDVCSSDLVAETGDAPIAGAKTASPVSATVTSGCASVWDCGTARSEERRVGKECRSRWSPYSRKKEEEVRDK